MQEVGKKYEDMRVLLREQGTQRYLQPDGSWSGSRETARTFTGVVVAYYWALEQKLLGIEVLLAFHEEKWDHVAMRI